MPFFASCKWRSSIKFFTITDFCFILRNCCIEICMPASRPFPPKIRSALGLFLQKACRPVGILVLYSRSQDPLLVPLFSLRYEINFFHTCTHAKQSAAFMHSDGKNAISAVKIIKSQRNSQNRNVDRLKFLFAPKSISYT